MSKPRRKRTTRVASFNAHVGLGLMHLGLRWLIRRHPRLGIILIQEGRERRKGDLRRNLPRRFRLWPRQQPGGNGEEAMTYVAFNRIRYRLDEAWNYDIQKGPGYPRKLTAVLLWDRLERCLVLAVSVHADPMGQGWQAPPGVMDNHLDQVDEYHDFVAKQVALHPGLRVVVGGDTNELLRVLAPQKVRKRSFMARMRQLKMKRAHVGRLDGLWFSWGDPEGSEKTVPVEGMDHPATVGSTR